MKLCETPTAPLVPSFETFAHSSSELENMYFCYEQANKTFVFLCMLFVNEEEIVTMMYG